MDTSSRFLSEDQFTCSICLDVYTEPVSTPCGHNFCKACITKHWAGKEQHQCPLCNNKFSKGLQVSVNTEFKEIVEKFKKRLGKEESTTAIKPGQVPCDCCPNNKVRATKTCLVCLVSFCDAHLDTHLRVAAFKSHKLTPPVHKLKDKICKRHTRILEFFCRSDGTRACGLCTEHRDHDTVHLEEAYVDRSARLGKRKEDVPKAEQNKGMEMKAAAQSKRKGKGQTKAVKVKSNQTATPFASSHRSDVPHQVTGRSFIPPNTDVPEGVHSFPINVKGRAGWHLVAVKESLCRGGRFPSINSDGVWSISPDNEVYTEKILVSVDYTNGVLLVLDADNGVVMYFTSCDFNEKLQFLFNPGHPASWKQILQRDFQKVSEYKYSFLHIILLGIMAFYFFYCLCREETSN